MAIPRTDSIFCQKSTFSPVPLSLLPSFCDHHSFLLQWASNDFLLECYGYHFATNAFKNQDFTAYLCQEMSAVRAVLIKIERKWDLILSPPAEGRGDICSCFDGVVKARGTSWQTNLSREMLLLTVCSCAHSCAPSLCRLACSPSDSSCVLGAW